MRTEVRSRSSRFRRLNRRRCEPEEGCHATIPVVRAGTRGYENGKTMLAGVRASCALPVPPHRGTARCQALSEIKKGEYVRGEPHESVPEPCLGRGIPPWGPSNSIQTDFGNQYLILQ